MRFRKKTVYISVLIAALLLAVGLFAPRHVLRYFYWNFADINDHQKFPKLEVLNDPQNISLLPKKERNFQFHLPDNFKNGHETNFDDFLADHDAVAFLVVHRDTLIYENYFDGYHPQSVVPSFSVSKAFVSALTGIAIDEGYIYSTRQSITFFLKELAPEFDAIAIEDLLNMRSGIKFDEGYSNPMADMAKYYYGTNLLDYISDLQVEQPANEAYHYNSVNSLLLGLIVERATNTKLSTYLQQKIWKPAGMESAASWSIDADKNKTVKAFCCINAIARDYARFGLIYLHEGSWNGKQIVPAQWVHRSTQVINNSRDSQNYPYTYQWRVLENGAFFAKGILGQYVLVYPARQLVFVRLGTSYGEIDWADFFITLSGQVK